VRVPVTGEANRLHQSLRRLVGRSSQVGDELPFFQLVLGPLQVLGGILQRLIDLR